MKYSKYYKMIDTSKYDFTENGIYSKRTGKLIEGYPIGKLRKYYQTKLRCVDGKERSLYIHTALWIYFNGDIPEGYEINHRDLNQNNNTLSNLELLTHRENMNYGDTQIKKANGIRNSDKIRKRREGN